MKLCGEKIVVFDMDQTLGCFEEIGMFWDALNKIKERDENHFFEVMDLFPEFLRPKILTILKSILIKKSQGKCSKIMIYTNNNGPKTWSQMIANYFEHKLGEKVFIVISAFKFNNNIVETCRTCETKNTTDLLRCANVSPETKICFFDDQLHPSMKHDNVYYINIKPFHYSFSFKTMTERYSKKYIDDNKQPQFIDFIIKYMSKFRYIVTHKMPDETTVDEVVGKQMMLHVNKFFSETTHSKTLSNRKYSVRKSRKR